MTATHSYIAARPRARSAGIIGRFAPAHWIALRRQRRQLAELEDHQLADIGVSRAEAKAEAARPAWDVPAHWMTLR